jgi:hypothetical protein
MKLQKRFNRKVGGKEYSKWVVNLPNEEIEKIGWKAGMELELDIRENRMILRPKKEEN